MPSRITPLVDEENACAAPLPLSAPPTNTSLALGASEEAEYAPERQNVVPDPCALIAAWILSPGGTSTPEQLVGVGVVVGGGDAGGSYGGVLDGSGVGDDTGDVADGVGAGLCFPFLVGASALSAEVRKARPNLPDVSPSCAPENVPVEVDGVPGDIAPDAASTPSAGDDPPGTLFGVVTGRQEVAAKPTTTTKRDALGHKRI